MKIQKNIPLATYTSLACGGPAEQLIIADTNQEFLEAIAAVKADQPLWVLGFGTNILVSDEGLPGLTIICRQNHTEWLDDATLVAEAGAWWDHVVKESIAKKRWGLELLSGIPSSLGGAVFGNIAAYGQQISQSLAWVEVFNTHTQTVERLRKAELTFSYRASSLQTEPHQLILRAGFSLATHSTTPLAYSSALAVARELERNPPSLSERREIILETRRRAGALYDPADPQRDHTAGSFFKNPLVSLDQAKTIASFDETGQSLQLLLKQNQLHGASASRVSAAHVLLAAGFKRGQRWGKVRLHPEHVLKLENIGGAGAQEIYQVAQEIMSTVKKRLSIQLEPEVRFLGNFN